MADFRRGTKSKGHHPRDPANKASHEPTAELPGTHDGKELGSDVEDKALEGAIAESNHTNSITYENAWTR